MLTTTRAPLCFLCLLVCLWPLLGSAPPGATREYAITLDDPHLHPTPMLTAARRAQNIRKHLQKAGKKAILFVCGKRVDSPKGRRLLRAWSQAGHELANHSYSHRYFHSPKVTLDAFRKDMVRNHQLLHSHKGFVRLFRFPYLKEGNTRAKRDGMRRLLTAMKYRNGHVSIDASDWYIDLRLRRRLKRQPKASRKGYRTYYLQHMWDRAQYYDGLAQRLLGRPVKHVMLLHHNLLNALFLGDLIQHFRAKGWRLIDADKAYQAPLYKKQPRRLPAGESLLWSLAKERGLKGLRYPAESGKYERPTMTKRGL